MSIGQSLPKVLLLDADRPYCWAKGLQKQRMYPTNSQPPLAAALGGNVNVLRDATEFDKLLIRAAPHARQKIDLKPLSPVTPPRSARR